MIRARIESKPVIVIEMDEADYKELVHTVEPYDAKQSLPSVAGDVFWTQVMPGQTIHHGDRLLGFAVNGLVKLRAALSAQRLIP